MLGARIRPGGSVASSLVETSRVSDQPLAPPFRPSVRTRIRYVVDAARSTTSADSSSISRPWASSHASPCSLYSTSYVTSVDAGANVCFEGKEADRDRVSEPRGVTEAPIAPADALDGDAESNARIHASATRCAFTSVVPNSIGGSSRCGSSGSVDGVLCGVPSAFTDHFVPDEYTAPT